MSKINDLIEKRKNKNLYNRSIRLAVVGNTAFGKTYFLEDVFAFLPSKLGFKSSDEVGHFGYISNFATDIRESKAKSEECGNEANSKASKDNYGLDATPAYACRHRDQYSVLLTDDSGKSFRFSFLDIPGEIINDGNLNGCKEVYNELKKIKEAKIWLTTWENRKTGEIRKTVSWNEIELDNVSDYEKNNNEYEKLNSTIRSRRYAPTTDYLSFFKHFYKIKEKGIIQITGTQFIEDYYDIDADSSYQLICEFYDSVVTKIRKSEQEYKDDIAKNFYYYYFLFQATDIIILQRQVVGNKKETTLLDNAGCLSVLKGNKYLGFKGVDEFFDSDKFTNYCTSIKEPANTIYSTLAMKIGALLVPANDNGNVNSENVVTMDENQKSFVKNSIQSFQGIANYNTDHNITRHTYFIATPITWEYKIDSFERTTIIGDSSEASKRCFFGSLQIIEDVMLKNGKKLPDEYKVCDDFLNFIRGNDKH